MFRTASYTIASLLLSACLVPGAMAADAQDCAQIREPVDRLRCFDRMFPPNAAVLTQDLGNQRRADKPVATQAEEEEDHDDGRLLPRLPENPLFGFKNDEEINSVIKAVRRQDKQKMVFLLENEQIWIQSNPRLMRIREGEEVRIEQTLTGGHMLHTASGVSTRVRRIR